MRTFCKAKGLDAAPYLKKLREAPRLTLADWSRQRARFEQVLRVISQIIEITGLPLLGYVLRRLTDEVMARRTMSLLTLKAISYVKINYANSCTLEACAKKLGCHPVHLSRTFKKEAGMDFHEHVHHVRIEHARHLLHVRAMNATRVGYEVGYADASHFTRVFKRITGQTPAVFARSSQRV